MKQQNGRRRVSGRKVGWLVGSAVWLGVLFGMAMPAWQQAVQQHRQVQDLEVQLAALDDWTVAGLWVRKSLGPRQAIIDPQWERLFPARAAKEDFFLDLAGVADRSGVGEFELREQAVPDEVLQAEILGGDILPLKGYRIKARFKGQYAQVADFLGGLKGITRAVSVHNLAIKPAREAVQVDLELDVYVSPADQS